MSDVNYRLGLAVRRADAEFEKSVGDTTSQWIPLFLLELEKVGLEICLTQRAVDGDALREKNVMIVNVGGGSFREAPRKTCRRR